MLIGWFFKLYLLLNSVVSPLLGNRWRKELWNVWNALITSMLLSTHYKVSSVVLQLSWDLLKIERLIVNDIYISDNCHFIKVLWLLFHGLVTLIYLSIHTLNFGIEIRFPSLNLFGLSDDCHHREALELVASNILSHLI